MNLSSLRRSGGGCIIDTVDEIFSDVPNAGELSIFWQMFGSNGHEKADYSRGVLDRFTRRASKDEIPLLECKSITNPRRIHHMESPHWAALFEGFIPVTEDQKLKTSLRWKVESKFSDKIVINHYHCKSLEEYAIKRGRGYAADMIPAEHYTDKQFEESDRNEIFDDGILHYRAERAKVFKLPDKSRADERLFNALAENLFPTLLPNTPPEFYAGKMETFLTCRAVAAYLQTKLINPAPAKFFEEAALVAVLNSIGQMSFADARLLLTELPTLLTLPYSAAKELREACLQVVPQLMNVFRLNNRWIDYVELDYILRLLKLL